ncbi:MAG: serine/threonine-protein kinase [Deltaproteobacteria bacterium]
MANAEDFSALTEVVSGRFRMRRLVAFGGMANIYEVEDLHTGRVGALKLLKARFRNVADAVERLSREAEAAAQIADPHIVETLDAGRLATGEPFLFMELLEGEPLDRAISRRGRLPLAESLEIVAQAAHGLAAAHAADILHRDIKPANLFLVAGPKTFVKLLDFGVSKFVGAGLSSMTREGLALGTFSYMPPEQMMGAKRVDVRADIYALGVVLYQCLVGTPPFVAKSIPALSTMMAQNEYVRVSRVRPDVPVELDAILERSLRADPSERYGGMREFREDLVRLSRRSLPSRTLSVGEALPPVSRAPAHSDRSRASVPPMSGSPLPTRSSPVNKASIVETVVPRTRRKP